MWFSDLTMLGEAQEISLSGNLDNRFSQPTRRVRGIQVRRNRFRVFPQRGFPH